MNKIFYAKIQNGLLVYRNPEQVAIHLKDFKEDCEVEIIIKKKSDNRTILQNRYYWAIVNVIAKSLGFDKDTMHEALKYTFLQRKVGILTFVKSTKKLNKIEFTQYIERIKAKFGNKIMLPDPSGFDYIDGDYYDRD